MSDSSIFTPFSNLKKLETECGANWTAFTDVETTTAQKEAELCELLAETAPERHFSADGARKVPRFLVNDFIRYWRTICVDYAAKHWDQGGAKWAIRNAKLRFSRKLLGAVGLAFCYSCELDPPESECKHLELFPLPNTPSAEPFIEAGIAFARTPPLDYLAAFIESFVEEESKRQSIANDVFGSYNDWLTLLNDSASRSHLEDLSHREAKDGDPVFQEVRNMSTSFARGLKRLFFNRTEDNDPIANLSLEYVGF